jgi:hypothetical protein
MKNLMIKITPEPRDFAETARVSALIGCGGWLFWAVFFSFFYSAFEDRSFGDVFPGALKVGVLFGLAMALVTAPNVVSVRATVHFSDKKEFVAWLNMATSQLGYVAAPVTSDFLTFKPSFKTGGFVGMVSVQLEDDHAEIVGPKRHVCKIVKRLETV